MQILQLCWLVLCSSAQIWQINWVKQTLVEWSNLWQFKHYFLKKRFWHFSAINQFPAMQSLFSIAFWACFAFSTAIRIVACLLICLFFCENNQIEFFSSFKFELKVSISFFSIESSSFIEKDLTDHELLIEFDMFTYLNFNLVFITISDSCYWGTDKISHAQTVYSLLLKHISSDWLSRQHLLNWLLFKNSNSLRISVQVK